MNRDMIESITELPNWPTDGPRLLEELKRTRNDFEKATWVLQVLADQIDEWFPDDQHPIVQNDCRQFAAVWQSKFDFMDYHTALAVRQAEATVQADAGFSIG